MAARREAEHAVLGEQSLAGLEPAEAQVLERVVERQLELAPAASVVPRMGRGRQPQAHLPHELAPGESDPVAPAHPHQILARRALELRGRAPHDVAHAPERAALLALGHDRGRRLLAPISDEREAYPHDTSYPSPFPGLQPAFSLVC